MSLKYWKSFLLYAVQHLLHPTNTILHHHIRKSGVKEKFNNKQKLGAVELKYKRINPQQVTFMVHLTNINIYETEDIFSASLHCRAHQLTESHSCVGVFLAAGSP